MSETEHQVCLDDEAIRLPGDIQDGLNDEAIILAETFQQTGRPEDLNQAIEHMEMAICIAGEHMIPAQLNNYGAMLHLQFKQTGLLDDLHQAVATTSKAVIATPHNALLYNDYISNLESLLDMLFEHLKSPNDIDRAVSVVSEVVKTMPHNYRNRAAILNSLGTIFGIRYEQTGLCNDLDQAVSFSSEAVDATPRGNLDRIVYLNNLGAFLGTRLKQSELIDDINRAVSVLSEVVDIAPYNHPKRALFLSNLGNFLGIRYERMGLINDLNRAVDVAREALDVIPYDHPNYAGYLNNVGALLSQRAERMGQMDDLNEAISFTSKAVNAMPYSHEYRAGYQCNLGALLNARFKQTGLIEDLEQAISITSEAVDFIPQGHVMRPDFLFKLGERLGARFQQTGLMDDLHRQLSSFTESWHCTTAPPRLRVRSAYAAAKILILQEDWEQSYQLLQEAIALLPAVRPRALNRTDAHALLADVFGLAASATATALNAGKAPEDALRLLEQGRGIIAGLLMDMRGDITHLLHKHPGLAQRFTLLRDELDLPTQSKISPASTDNVSSWEIHIRQRHEADRDFNKVIDTIRAQPGFSDFLQPPTVKELMSTAEQGPIVILNISSFRCDAFLIQRSSIQVVELRSLNEDEVRQRVTSLSTTSNLSPLLEWLWHAICGPVLDALDLKHAITDDNWPHVWWIPTGLLSQLPLHAAGIYKQGSKDTVLDRAASSYASSIKALLHGRKHSIQKPRQPRPEDFALMVAMNETPGLGQRGYLPFAHDEVQMLRGLCSQLQLAPITPPRHKEDILTHLRECKLFHFAGHGQLDQSDPSQSCLLLEDWEVNPLTVGDIRDSWLQDNPPFLAYLSACSTGANKAPKLFDEGIHLVSAFQLAGFRHAIGTLWEVSDKHCVDVAKILYKTLQEEGITDKAVSRGLHRAVRALRNGDAEDMQARDAKLACPRPARQGVTDFFWVPYVHFGV